MFKQAQEEINGHQIRSLLLSSLPIIYILLTLTLTPGAADRGDPSLQTPEASIVACPGRALSSCQDSPPPTGGGHS